MIKPFINRKAATMAVSMFFVLNLNSQTTLKESLKGQFLIGVAMDSTQIVNPNGKDAKIIASNFNSIVAENCMKSVEIQPKEGVFDFTLADKMIEFGEKNNQFVVGHCLIWHSQLPNWFCADENGNNVSADLLKKRMRDHIYTVVSRYKGRVHGWDVVNEAIEDNGDLRNSRFYQILGEEYIELAFKYAHEADPDAELYYNDYSMSKREKYRTAIRIVNNLKNKGIRIDGVGMQGHMDLKHPTIDDYENAIIDISATGAKVMITELDISPLPNPFDRDVAEISKKAEYKDYMDPYKKGLPTKVVTQWNDRVMSMFDLFLKHSDKIGRVTFWGLTDKQSWKNDFPIKGRTDYAVFYDRKSEPKDVLKMIISAAEKNSIQSNK